MSKTSLRVFNHRLLILKRIQLKLRRKSCVKPGNLLSRDDRRRKPERRPQEKREYV
jgi:hypothetical protein